MKIKNRQEYLFQQVSNKDQLGDLFARNLIDLYQKVFADPPYEETFSIEEVRSYFELYFLSGILLFCENRESKEIIGFAAAIPLMLEKAIAQLATSFRIDPQKTWYFAELGVDQRFRGKGIATTLVKNLIAANPAEQLLMRTAKNNIPSIRVNMKLGFEQIEGMLQQVVQKRQDGTIKQDTRIFLSRKM